MNVNLVVLTGRLTKDVEAKASQSEKMYATFDVAVNGYNDRVDFVRVTAFNKTAEFLGEHAEKGDLVLVEGSLSQNKWTDQNGVKHSDLSVIAKSVQLLRKKNELPGAEVTSDTESEIVNEKDDIPF